MKHAASLVCIIWVCLFLSSSSFRPGTLPEADPSIHVGEAGHIESGEADRMPDKTEDSSAVSHAGLPLEGRVICLDPGHQARMNWKKAPVAPEASLMMPDFSIGTKGIRSGTYEYGIALEVAKKLKKDLTALGARVVLTRNSDHDMVGNSKRAKLSEEINADIFISLHCDGVEDPAVHGISVLYPGDKYIEDESLLESSLTLSKAILQGAVEATKARNRGLSRRNNLIIFNYSRVPCTLIEMGFLTNPEEDKLLNTDDYQNKLVKGMISGIRNYFSAHESKTAQ